MVLQFVYTPEEFDTRLEIASDWSLLQYDLLFLNFEKNLSFETLLKNKELLEEEIFDLIRSNHHLLDPLHKMTQGNFYFSQFFF